MKQNRKEHRDKMLKTVYGKVPKDERELKEMVLERLTAQLTNTESKETTNEDTPSK